ncbi:GNAT family N-acetyltransferase [Roseobacter sp. YSTF-M11]|uniref:GNAT family N-acetyltransferase n=1 Tax=Roseobacter insulae TaxID=2859783 RepID=A0A9X1K1P5_9RHOB|nr:GNAT family N-acetyltransferase [Roseobacter insulae]MBW4709439.1 GNAT family N-acetyltransferase [Roseobacter insulae]
MLSNGFHDIPPGKVAMIVTYLEMTSKAVTMDITLPDGVSFRRVTPDLAWYRNIFTRVGALDWLWYGRLMLNDVELGSILNDPKVEVFTLSRDGQDEALLELDFRSEGSCELAYFGVTGSLIGTGSGRYLMNEAITRAWAQPISRFHVHTCTIDSPQALNFYRRSGFTPVRQAVEIDEDPRVIDILPEHAGPNVPILRP